MGEDNKWDEQGHQKHLEYPVVSEITGLVWTGLGKSQISRVCTGRDTGFTGTGLHHISLD